MPWGGERHAAGQQSFPCTEPSVQSPVSRRARSEEREGYHLSTANSEPVLIQVQSNVVDAAPFSGLPVCAGGRAPMFQQTVNLNSRPGLLGEFLPEEPDLEYGLTGGW